MSMQALRTTVIVICGLTLLVAVLAFLGGLYVFTLVPILVILFLTLFYLLVKSGVLFHSPIHVISVFTLLSHGLGVFLPEVGFDALWYHLPLIHEYSVAHRLLYLQEWYQSLYPQYGDLLFVMGYAPFGMVGAKMIGFIFFLLLFLSCFIFLKEKLSRPNALLGSLCVALFQVVSWQASSIYVDVMSAVFFLWGSIFLFTRKHSTDYLLSAMCMGIFLGTKFINLGFIPLLFILSLMALNFRKKQFWMFWLITSLIAVPWYLRAGFVTGNFLYPIGTEYSVPVIQQMGVSGWSEWLMLRVPQLWKLPTDFLFANPEYISPFFFVFLGVTLFSLKRSFSGWKALLIGGYGLLFWFLFPPPSTRYVIGPLIVSWIFMCRENFDFLKKSPRAYLGFRTLVFLSLVFFLSIRLVVNARGIPYLLGKETKAQYLERFRNGFLDEKIDSFYSRYR